MATDDATRQDRAEALLAMHGAILERVAGHEPLHEVLEALALAVEELADGMLASILLVDHGRLRHGGAPSLPDAYNAAIDGVEIGPAVGSCGTAAYRGTPVVVEDVMEDPLWADFRELAAEHDLRACWSTPIMARDGTVLGTFALYYRRPSSPGEEHSRLVEAATHLARIAIEHDRAERELRESERRFRTVATEVPVGIFETDGDGALVFANEHLCRIMERGPERMLGRRWLDYVHPADVERVDAGWKAADAAGAGAWVSEHRIVTPSGGARHVSARAVPLRDADGSLTGILGSYLDMSERKDAEEQRRVLERERLIAQTLQRALLPGRLPEVEGVQVAARYMPGAAGMQVGGDWYDLFELPDSRLGVVIGDVMGRGAPAAAAMGQLRIALRSTAALMPAPARVLERLNEDAARDGQLATLVYGTLTPQDGTFRYACAGHPPPLVGAAAGGARYLDEGRNPPLGVIEEPPEEGVVGLAEGETLLLYTDGLIERRDESLDAGLATLVAAFEEHRRDLHTMCDAILARLGAHAAGDDVALLALRLTHS